MRRIFFILCLTIISKFCYAHDQGIHQYIVREAWKLLEYQVPELDGSILEIWVGNDEQAYLSKIVAGAYNEDEYDVIFRYCGYTLALGCTYATNTHFWDADNGGESRFYAIDFHDCCLNHFTSMHN